LGVHDLDDAIGLNVDITTTIDSSIECLDMITFVVGHTSEVSTVESTLDL
jgi:hypothetical protein